MITVHVKRRAGSRRDKILNKSLARLMLLDLRKNTPVKTGKLRKGWTITEVNGSSFTIENDVYYGYWVNEGNTNNLKPRRFTQKAVREWLSDIAGMPYEPDYHRPKMEFIEP